MDLKYHSFIRSVSGSFITLGDNSKITLNQREYINEKKAFEIGSCSKCNLYKIYFIKSGIRCRMKDTVIELVRRLGIPKEEENGYYS